MHISKTSTAVTPRYSDNGSAGMDLYVDTAIEYELLPGEIYHLPTGIRVEIPRNYFGAIYSQNNLHKKGLVLTNSVGIINSSDRGEIILSVKNIFSDIVRINGQWGLRTPIAQLIIQPYRFEKIDVSVYSRLLSEHTNSDISGVKAVEGMLKLNEKNVLEKGGF